MAYITILPLPILPSRLSVSFHISNTSLPSENTIHLRKLPPAMLHTLFLVILSQVSSKQVSNYTTEEFKMTQAQVAFPESNSHYIFFPHCMYQRIIFLRFLSEAHLSFREALHSWISLPHSIFSLNSPCLSPCTPENFLNPFNFSTHRRTHRTQAAQLLSHIPYYSIPFKPTFNPAVPFL